MAPTDPDQTTDIPAAVPVDDFDPSATTDQPPQAASNPEETQSQYPSTQSQFAQPTRESTSTPAVPGYQIESVLGRGGMGIVYKALHLALKRTVALKMVLAGGHAGPRELIRFRIEVEAAARLLHPNIVQIHEVGEVDGHPYCALEYVEGGTLAKSLATGPMAPDATAELVAKLSRAMQLAHSRNVVHRDLKPANILISVDDTPKIADFGLARQLDNDSGETQAGTVMGTPSYMAPEQASGHGHEAGPAADIYALGAILYDCLTGRPPFKGTSVLETLDQVRSQEPTPPSRLRAGVPLDLETICLKCLQKEPVKRYASAAELAEELGRFLRREPILARPVSRAERGWRWCRRNPLLAAALVTAVSALVAATIVSTLFGLDAQEKERTAVKARNDLADKNTLLELSQEEIKRQNTELEHSNDKLQGALTLAWLSPLSATPNAFLSDPEIDSFRALAVPDNKDLAQRFVRESLKPQWRRKLGVRAPFALHAVVGMDSPKRQEVERLLMTGLDLLPPSNASRTDLAMASAALGGLSPTTAKRTSDALLKALATEADPNRLKQLAQSLVTLARTQEPGEAAHICGMGMPPLMNALQKSLMQAATGSPNVNDPKLLAQALALLGRHLSQADAGRLAVALSQAMSKPNSPALSELTQALIAVADRLDSQTASKVAENLVSPLTKSGEVLNGVYSAQGLVAVADRLTPADITKHAAALTGPISKTSDAFGHKSPAQGLTALAPRLEAKQAGGIADALTKAILSQNTFSRSELSQTLSAVISRMETKEAVRVLSELVAKVTDAFALKHLKPGFATLAPRLDSKQAASLALALTTAMSNEALNPFALQELQLPLALVTSRLDSPDAAKAVDALLRAMAKMSPVDPEELARSLPAMVARLDSKEATRLTSTIVTRLTQARTQDRNTFRYLALWVPAVANHLDSTQINETADAVSEALTLFVEDHQSNRTLATALEVVAGRLPPQEAARVCGGVVKVLTTSMMASQSEHPTSLASKAMCLASIAPRLSPKEVNSACTQAAALLAKAISEAPDTDALQPRVAGLIALSRWMGPNGRTEAAGTLIQAMTKDYRSRGEFEIPAPPDGARILTDALSRMLNRKEHAFSEQELVQLLKHPLCIDPARRVILDQLGVRQQRQFGDQWDYVRFAEQQKLPISFTASQP